MRAGIVVICVVAVLCITVDHYEVQIKDGWKHVVGKEVLEENAPLTDYEQKVLLEARVKKLEKDKAILEQAWMRKDDQIKVQNKAIKDLMSKILPLVPREANDYLNEVLKPYNFQYKIKDEVAKNEEPAKK